MASEHERFVVRRPLREAGRPETRGMQSPPMTYLSTQQVPETDVRRSVAWLVRHEQVVAEGSGAIAIAPLLNGQLDANGQRVVAVLTGRNIDATLLLEILEQTRI